MKSQFMNTDVPLGEVELNSQEGFVFSVGYHHFVRYY